MNALIVGASRGIGLALVRELLERSSGRVVASHRGPAPELAKLQGETGLPLTLVRLDVTNESSVAKAAARVRESVGCLHLLINVAGVLHDENMQPERRLEHIDPDAFALSFAVNATGPALVAKHFHPLFDHGERAVLASISARVGSISDNRLGGWYGYRASKAAQNMVTKTLSIELARRAPNVICVALHPGTVDTDLSKPFQRSVPAEKLFAPKRAAVQLLRIVDSLKTEDSGSFFDWKRERVPW
jgi:NAD(P)-dependent dehydrogenase (short-subunit alcohol dehydrogenase family)